ncbi:MAG: GIY-YIG nuclease family protein, partial [bacterium]|nr:GIY-YIG nuclease family protein [bacterium]
MNNPQLSAELALFLSQLPEDPGVYRMIDAEGVILYVGKASNLKKRVTSYFNKQNSGIKTRSLVSQITSIQISVTRSETEALLLESNLIKALRPKYNILLRDDKSYPYIHISDHQQYPRIESYRSKKKPLAGNFFGPYPSGLAVKETIVTIQKVFKLRTCRDSYFNARSRPCLQYQIKRCTAPCVNYVTPEQYSQSVQDAMRFLQGKCQLIL